MSLRYLFVDFNAFFASVEQTERAELRGRPVAVVPVMSDTTSCIAASYEARAFGIRTGTRVGEARRVCPDLVCVLARHELYVHYHRRLMTLLDQVLPVEKVMSIDEALCELPTRWRRPEQARAKALEIKAGIADEFGPTLKCSIGIAANGFLAKTAAEMHKPDGLTLLPSDALPQALYPLQLRDLCGIGPRMEQRLRKAGIATIEHLCAASPGALRAAWGGIGGEVLYRQLRGQDVAHTGSSRHSISHSHVLAPALRNATDARAVLHRLLQKAALRMRTLDLDTAHLSLALRFARQPSWHADVTMAPTRDDAALARLLDRLWNSADNPVNRQPPLAVGLALSRLSATSQVQAGLFDDTQRNQRLTLAADQVRLKFGKKAAYLGAARRGNDAAPLRIAFNRIPDPATER